MLRGVRICSIDQEGNSMPTIPIYSNRFYTHTIHVCVHMSVVWQWGQWEVMMTGPMGLQFYDFPWQQSYRPITVTNLEVLWDEMTLSPVELLLRFFWNPIVFHLLLSPHTCSYILCSLFFCIPYSWYTHHTVNFIVSQCLTSLNHFQTQTHTNTIKWKWERTKERNKKNKGQHLLCASLSERVITVGHCIMGKRVPNSVEKLIQSENSICHSCQTKLCYENGFSLLHLLCLWVRVRACVLCTYA